MKPVFKSVAGNGENQDRGCVIGVAGGIVLLVADGAGGMAGGARAAAMAVEFAQQRTGYLTEPSGCTKLLHAMDRHILQEESAGETTCALAVARGGRIFGSSVGDSGVWILGSGSSIDLTCNQARKPFIGSGNSRPVEFSYGPARQGEKLLLATDGLLKYAPAVRIVEVCAGQDNEACATGLIELVRYRSGSLPDDVTVILAAL